MPLTEQMYLKALSILRDSDDAADVVQEALTNLWQIRDKLDTIDNLGGYCIFTARNIALDRTRRHVETTGLDTTAAYEDVRTNETSRRLDDSDELKRVLALMGQLPESQQRVIRLNAIDGYDSTEIARITGFTLSNVRQLLSRGRQKLRQLYRQ